MSSTRQPENQLESSPADSARAAAPSIDVTITHLQMLQRPETTLPVPPREGLVLVHAQGPTVSFYRYLYNTIGRPWLWIDRRKLSDQQLASIVQNENVEVHVLYADGVPAGYVELDRRQPPDIELAYFGLMPEFIGHGLGPYLLRWAIHLAWSYQPARFWLHTCTFDHPKALEMYKRAGFVVFKTEVKREVDPRSTGLL